MRRFRYIFFSILLAGSLFSQHFNYAHQHGDDYSWEIVQIGLCSYHLERQHLLSASCEENIVLVGIDQNNQTFMHKNIAGVTYPENVFIRKSTDKHLWVSFGSEIWSCDLGITNYYLKRIDTAGTVTWEKEFSKPVVGLAESHDGGCYYILPDSIFRISASGILLQADEHNMGTVSSTARINHSEILVCHVAGSGPNLRRYDDTLNADNDVLIGYALTKMAQQKDSCIIGLGNGVLRKYSPSLAWMQNSTDHVPGAPFTSFTLRGDSILATGTGTYWYMLMGNSFFPLHVLPSYQQGTIPTGIVYTPAGKTRIIATGTHVTKPCVRYTSFHQFDLAGTLHTSRDIGVVSATVNPIGFYETAASLQIDATIKNFGTDTVFAFNLTHWGTIGLWNTATGLLMPVQTTIAPGGSVTVSTPQFLRSMLYSVPNGSATEICIMTSVPDNLDDKNRNNDFWCQNVVFTSIADNRKQNFSVGPNPSSGSFEINGISEPATLTIMDHSGRRVRSYSLEKDHQKISHDLQPGIYIFRLESSSQNGLFKLIVSD